MGDWLTIKEVKHGMRKDKGEATFVVYEVEDEPGYRYMAVFKGHLPENTELARETERKHLNKGIKQTRR